MNGGAATYNERSWSIDLIGHLKQLASRDNRSIKDAGGEQTVKARGNTLFPDILLFGDRTTARILQGWELKMPDTCIHDNEFRDNAETKARALGLDSFVLWNVSHAHLYIRDADTDAFVRSHAWSDLRDVTTRVAVVRSRARWEELAGAILSFLNDLFDRGTLQGRQFIDAYRSGGVTALIMENAGQVAEALVEASKRDGTLRAEMVLWWELYRGEYAVGQMEEVLAKVVISNWIGKILFGHILREKDIRARRLAEIGSNTTPLEALDVFCELSQECNFWTIFSDSIGLKVIPDTVWEQLKQFNRLLCDLRVGSVDQGQVSSLLEATVEVTVRKLRGQYSTPIELARLLVNLCVRNKIDDRVLDPCCGSGTIARGAMEQKLAADLAPAYVAATVIAGDQDSQAVQIATFALTKPDLMNIPLRIYQNDAFALEPCTSMSFRDPTNGTIFTEPLGQFHAIISNLPFVAQEGRKRYEGAVARVAANLRGDGGCFTGRADVAAYFPFSLHSLLVDGGRLGVIITNAWLGTDWGDAFSRILGRYYDLKCVVTSGAGRWFKNSDVVTNILILEKKESAEQSNSDIKFVVLARPLEEFVDDRAAEIAAAQIELGRAQADAMTIREVSTSKLEQFRPLGLRGNAQFVDCDWILALPLIPLKCLFSVHRGERRGMNKLFYPSPGHGIESHYIRPLVKSPTEFSRLSHLAVKEAFSCSRTISELSALGHTGALNWIRRFETPEIVAKLRGSDRLWYEMKVEKLAELVMFINYGNRLFIGRVDPPAFADQRLVYLNSISSVDLDLAHALMNSTIGLFIIEGMGFGRGLGALDLSSDRIKNFMHMLDPSQLNQSDVLLIKAAFAPLLQREILDVADELEQSDRHAFDDAVFTAFGLDIDPLRVYDALLSLVEVRQTATIK